MQHPHKVDVRLSHRVDVGEAARYLVGALGCDEWYAACQHEHLFIVQFSRHGKHRFAVRFECTSPVEKAIYHSSKTWSLSIVPLGEEEDLLPGEIAEIKAGLTKL